MYGICGTCTYLVSDCLGQSVYLLRTTCWGTGCAGLLLYMKHQTHIITVKPVYKGHPRDNIKVAVMSRWPFYTGSFTHKMILWDLEIVAFIAGDTGGYYSRFYCSYICELLLSVSFFHKFVQSETH